MALPYFKYVPPCTFCNARGGPKFCTIIDDPIMTRFLCEEYKINYEEAFEFDNQDSDHNYHKGKTASLTFPLCKSCYCLFARMGRIKVQFDEAKRRVDDVLDKIRLRVVGFEDKDDKTVSRNCRILRSAISRGRSHAGASQEIQEFPAAKKRKTDNLDLETSKAAVPTEAGNSLINTDFGTIEPIDIHVEEIQVKVEQDMDYEPEESETLKNYDDVDYEIDGCEMSMEWDVTTMNTSNLIQEQPTTSDIKSEKCPDLETVNADERSFEEIQNEWKLKYLGNERKCRFCSMTHKSAAPFRFHEIQEHHDRLLHVCTSCDEKFSSAAILDTHNQIHDSSGPYKCQICTDADVVLNNRIQVQNHLLMVHVPPEPFILTGSYKETACLICKKVFKSNNDLSQHVKKSHDRKETYACEICSGSKFTTPHGLVKHTVQFHENGTIEKGLSCQKCSKTFATAFMLRRHIMSHRFDETKPLRCDVCDAQFYKDEQVKLEHHIKSNHGTQKESRHACPAIDCDKTYPSQSHLRCHEIKHHPELFVYNCKLCEKSYSIEKFLETHMRTHSDIETLGGSFPCGLCASRYSTPDGLADHLCRHTGESKWACSKCSKKFETGKLLSHHLVHEHGEDKPFKCDVCHKGFLSNPDLKYHKERHADPEDLLKGEPRACPHCAEVLNSRTAFRSHMRKHKPKKVISAMICQICGKSVKNLKLHLEMHEGKKKRICYFCGKSTQQRIAHLYHMYTHTKEKPYSCHICHAEYNQAQCLSKHMKKKHNSDQTHIFNRSDSTAINTNHTNEQEIHASDLNAKLAYNVNLDFDALIN